MFCASIRSVALYECVRHVVILFASKHEIGSTTAQQTSRFSSTLGIIATVLAALLRGAVISLADAQPKSASTKPAAKSAAPAGPSSDEATARACIHTRLQELVDQQITLNLANDAALSACGDNVRAEFKKQGKSYCEAVDYIGWLVAAENSKLNGLPQHSYKSNKGFIATCGKTENWDKHPTKAGDKTAESK